MEDNTQLCQFVFARNRCRNFAPCFLYTSDPALRNASQICATLRPSEAAIASIRSLRSDRTLKVNRVSFFMFAKFYHCFSAARIQQILTIVQTYVILYHPRDDMEDT